MSLDPLYSSIGYRVPINNAGFLELSQNLETHSYLQLMATQSDLITVKLGAK